jgi:hypothetical protein
VILDYWVDAHDGDVRAGDDADDVLWATRTDLERLDCVAGLHGWLAEHGVLDRLRR